MGLYDKYQLINSTQIPQYKGSALPEFARMVEMAQERYDTASQGALGINDTVTNSPFLSQDAGTWKRIKSDTDKELEQWSSRGDYENLLPDVQRKARVVASRLKPIVESVQKRAEYAKSLDDKDLNLTELDKKTLLEISDTAYKGIQYDENGRGFGLYSGRPAEKTVDTNETIRKALSIMNPSSEIRESGTENGMWEIKTKNGWRRITVPEIDEALKHAYANDVEWKAHINQQIDLETFRKMKSHNVDDVSALEALKKMPEGDLKSKAMNAIAKGYSAKDIYTDIATQVKRKEVESGIMASIAGYAHAKAFNESQSGTVQQYSDIYEMNYKHNLDKQMEDYKQTLKDRENYTPYIVQGPMTKLTDDEKDPAKVTQKNTELKGKITSAQQEIDMYKNELSKPNLSAQQKAQLQSNIKNAQDRLDGLNQEINRNEMLLGYVRDKTAQNMGYAGYDKFLKEESGKLVPEIKKLYPNGLTTKSGKVLSANDIAQAIVDGRAYPQKTAGIKMERGYEAPAVIGINIIDKDGQRIYAPLVQGNALQNDVKGLNEIINQVQQGKKSRLVDFNKKFNQDYRSNIKDFSIGSDHVGFANDEMRKEITTVLKGSLGGIEFSEQGQFENLSESDRPEDFRVLTFRPQGRGGQMIFQGEELDKEGKKTGRVIDIKVNDVNIAKRLAEKLYASGTKEGMNVATMILPNSGARILGTQRVGDRIALGKVEMENGKIGELTIQSFRNADNSITWNLYDDQGDVKESTNSISVAGRWYDQFRGINTKDADFWYTHPKKKTKSITTTSKTVKKTITNAED